MICITDQDRINEQNCCLIIKGGKLTGRVLALAMKVFLDARKQANSQKLDALKYREETVAELLSQGKELPSIPISEENIKSFESVARKYGIDFEVRQDLSAEGSPWFVFFKSKEKDAMEKAFNEYFAKECGHAKDKPSLKQTIQNMMEKVKNQVFEKTRHKEREL